MGITVAFIAGCAAGILSGWGVGGGTLLMLWLVNAVNVPQHEAQGINLLYFLPCSLAAVYSHIKNGLVDKAVFLPAAVSGAVFTAGAAMLASVLDGHFLRRIFGIFLLIIGLIELFKK